MSPVLFGKVLLGWCHKFSNGGVLSYITYQVFLLKYSLLISFQGYVQEVWEAMFTTLTDEQLLQKERKDIKDMTPVVLY
jgi:hypothetical protein